MLSMLSITTANAVRRLMEVAALIRKGDRLVNRFGPNEWRLGIITKINDEYVWTTYDDGTKDRRKLDDPGLCKTAFQHSRAILLNDRQVENIGYQFLNSQLISTGTEKPKFDVLGSDDASRMEYMEQLWKFYNKTKFSSRMVLPRLEFLRDQDATKFRTRGQWKATGRVLSISRRKFNATEESFCKTFLHEMCHQAVSEIDKTVESVNKGHGPKWRTWMIRVGLDPEQYDKEGNDLYLDDEERGIKKEREDKQRYEARKLEPHDLAPLTPAQYLSSKTHEWVRGILACRVNGQKWAFVAEGDYSNNHSIIPTGMLYYWDDNQAIRRVMSDRRLLKKVDDVQHHYT